MTNAGFVNSYVPHPLVSGKLGQKLSLCIVGIGIPDDGLGDSAVIKLVVGVARF